MKVIDLTHTIREDMPVCAIIDPNIQQEEKLP